MTFQQLQNVQFESERNIPFILAEQRGHPAEIVMNFHSWLGQELRKVFVFGCMETRFAVVLTSGAETGRCSGLDPGVLGWRLQGHNHGGLARQLTPGCCLLFVSPAHTWSQCCRTCPHLVLLLLSLLGQIKPALDSIAPRAPGCASTLWTCRSLLRSRGKKLGKAAPCARLSAWEASSCHFQAAPELRR